MLKGNNVKKIFVCLAAGALFLSNALSALTAAALLQNGIDAYNKDFDSVKANENFSAVIKTEDSDGSMKETKIRAYFWRAKMALRLEDRASARASFQKMFEEYPDPFGDYRDCVRTNPADIAHIYNDEELVGLYRTEKKIWIGKLKETLGDMESKIASQGEELSLLRGRRRKFSIMAMLMTVILAGAYAAAK